MAARIASSDAAASFIPDSTRAPGEGRAPDAGVIAIRRLDSQDGELGGRADTAAKITPPSRLRA
ncbi:hypothetical protein [Methylosinus sp. Ce-a6]|uniref:hypothetical protein n=1 Tax=Methylosinus sp. Ce-a6 TaxID=2172005 RepID=UPI00135942EF|nr:hypothetical protein [Methylosinus sp. Ce-a6]